MLSSILGKSNLQFAGMSISLTISTASLNLRTPDSKQVCRRQCPALPRTPKLWLFERASCFQLYWVPVEHIGIKFSPVYKLCPLLKFSK